MEYDLDGTIIKKEYIALESAKNYKEVFKVEEIFAKKEEQKEVKEFIKQVASIKAHNWMHNSLEDKLKALRELGKKSNVDDDIIDIAVEAVKTVGEQ